MDIPGKPKISVLGCGWLGAPLAKHLADLGFDVSGSSRSLANISSLKEHGINTFEVDIESSKPIKRDFLASEILVVAITSKNVSAYDLLRSQIDLSPVKHVLHISSTGVYEPAAGQITETGKTREGTLSAVEHSLASRQFFNTTTLRLGGLFGYDRQPGNFFGPGKPIPNPDHPVNMIHRDDAIGLVEKIIEKDLWDNVFNGVSPDHPSRRNFYSHEFRKLGKAPPEFDANTGLPKLISGEKIIVETGYNFLYGDLLGNWP